MAPLFVSKCIYWLCWDVLMQACVTFFCFCFITMRCSYCLMFVFSSFFSLGWCTCISSSFGLTIILVCSQPQVCLYVNAFSWFLRCLDALVCNVLFSFFVVVHMLPIYIHVFFFWSVVHMLHIYAWLYYFFGWDTNYVCKVADDFAFFSRTYQLCLQGCWWFCIFLEHMSRWVYSENKL